MWGMLNYYVDVLLGMEHKERFCQNNSKKIGKKIYTKHSQFIFGIKVDQIKMIRMEPA